MSDKVSIESPVRVSLKDNSVAGIAYELMRFIGSDKELVNKDHESRRQFWLTLYRQCYKAARGNSLESILRRD